MLPAGRPALEALACRGASRLQERLPDCFARRCAVRSRTAAWDNAVRSETGERGPVGGGHCGARLVVQLAW